MKIKIFKNLFIYLLLFTPLSFGMISCSSNNKSNAKFKEEYLLYIKNKIAKFKIRDLFINVSKLSA